MTDTPRTDHYRAEFKRRKEGSELISWLLDEFAQEERTVTTLLRDLADARAKAAWAGPWQQGAYTYQEAMDAIATAQAGNVTLQIEIDKFSRVMNLPGDGRPLSEQVIEAWGGAQARIAALEEADRAWDKHSLVQLVAERRELRERVGHLEEMLGLAAAATNGWKILHEESQERVAKLEDLLNAYKNALRVHRQAEELVLMREKEWQGCQDPGYVVIDGGSLTLALEFSKDMTLANRDNLRADLQLAKERIAALTEALTGALTDEYLAGVEWGIKNVSVRADWPLSWEAGWPGMKAQALLDRAATREQAKETA